MPAHYFLLEESKFISQAHSIALDAERCHRIEEASCKSSEAAVSESRIRFHIKKSIQISAHFREAFSREIAYAEVEQIVLHQLSDEEFHGEVINLLIFLLFLSGQYLYCAGFFLRFELYKSCKNCEFVLVIQMFRVSSEHRVSYTFVLCFEIVFVSYHLKSFNDPFCYNFFGILLLRQQAFLS